MDHDKQCVLVIIGADAMGNKDIVGMVDGYRESAQSWKVSGRSKTSPIGGTRALRVALALRGAKQRGRFLWAHRVNHCTGG